VLTKHRLPVILFVLLFRLFIEIFSLSVEEVGYKKHW